MPPAVPDLASALKDGQPDWDAIDFDVLCPRCGYNLRLLPEPRCPECGLTFEWTRLFDVARWESDFLFEHHWRQRPFRSWWVTFWRGLRPWPFWNAVSLHERIHVGPLAFLLLSSVVVFLLLLHGGALLAWLVCLGVSELLESLRGAGLTYGLRRLGDDMLNVATVPFYLGLIWATVPATLLGIELAATLLLCSLHQTLGRCRVRAVQVFRVAAYAATPTCAGWAVILLGHVVLQAVCRGTGVSATEVLPTLFVLMGLPLIYGVFLAAGLKQYLRPPRSWLLGLTAAFVGLLFAVTAYMTVIFGFRR